MNSLEGKQINVLVVDDSAFMRKSISMMLESDPLIKVIATANNGEEGVAKVLEFEPDLVTMDIEMPRMDGLTALRKIMEKHPTPVLMVSSLTAEGASATLDALDLGAVDFIPKQLSYVSLDIVKIKDDLIAKIKDIVRRKHILMASYRSRSAFQKAKGGVKQRTDIRAFGDTSKSIPVIKKMHHPVQLIAIGSSTGGPPALQNLVTKLPRALPVGVVIAQHMPATFTKSLAERLNNLASVEVKEAEHNEPLKPGHVYIAPGGQHIKVRKVGSSASIIVTQDPRTALYKPSVDVLMSSVAEMYDKASIGVILTGMGQDGVKGMSLMKNRGAVIIAQNEESCVVYGMPRAVVEADLADHILPINDIASNIAAYF